MTHSRTKGPVPPGAVDDDSRDERRLDGATTIRMADYVTQGARVSWTEAQIERPEIRLPRLPLGDPAGDRDRR
jgi:hypothetical protein